MTLVYGGGSVGLMGILADAVHEHGGRVHGVITNTLHALEVGRESCDDFEVVDTMRDRKRRMEHLAEAFVAMPGGIGTYEEFFEILVGRLLGEHNKPLIIVNVNDHFRPLMDLIEHGIEHRFIHREITNLFAFVDTPEEAVAILHDPPPRTDSDPDRMIPSRQ